MTRLLAALALTLLAATAAGAAELAAAGPAARIVAADDTLFGCTDCSLAAVTPADVVAR